jgi:hypothetical protein
MVRRRRTQARRAGRKVMKLNPPAAEKIYYRLSHSRWLVISLSKIIGFTQVVAHA